MRDVKGKTLARGFVKIFLFFVLVVPGAIPLILLIFTSVLFYFVDPSLVPFVYFREVPAIYLSIFSNKIFLAIIALISGGLVAFFTDTIRSDTQRNKVIDWIFS